MVVQWLRICLPVQGREVLSLVQKESTCHRAQLRGERHTGGRRGGTLVEVLKEQLAEGHPVDVAIDCLGGEVMGKCLPYLKHGARWIMIAALAGQKTEIDLKNIYVRNVRIIGSTLRSRTPEVKAQILADLVKNVWPKVESGEVKPTIYKTLPIEEAGAAHDILYKGQNVGKVVLTVN